jgi:hypothetical protein
MKIHSFLYILINKYSLIFFKQVEVLYNKENKNN